MHSGFISCRQRYLEVLSSADIVVSTAIHDFQGLSVLEAAQMGCIPLVPDRLAYREYIPDQYRYPSTPEDPLRESQALAEKIVVFAEASETFNRDTTLAKTLGALKCSRLAVRYREVCASVGDNP